MGFNTLDSSYGNNPFLDNNEDPYGNSDIDWEKENDRSDKMNEYLDKMGEYVDKIDAILQS